MRILDGSGRRNSRPPSGPPKWVVRQEVYRREGLPGRVDRMQYSALAIIFARPIMDALLPAAPINGQSTVVSPTSPLEMLRLSIWILAFIVGAVLPGIAIWRAERLVSDEYCQRTEHH